VILLAKRETDYDEKQQNKVVVRNDFVRAIHPERMDLKTMKLFRLVISQCRKRDEELYSYDFKITDLAKALGIDSSNIYKDTETMCLNMMQMVLKYGGESIGKSWKMKHMFESCEYESKTGIITIKLHEEMSELVLRLGGQFTQIPISSVLMMKSKYAIRLYELICEKMKNSRPHDRFAVSILLSLEEIRSVTGTDKKKTYDKISNLKNKVILPAVQDIEAATKYKDLEEYTGWKIIVTDEKKGRKVTGFSLEIWDYNGYKVIEQYKQNGVLPPVSENMNEDFPGQMGLFDYMG
jgi:plasmid replication initiation protein